VTLRQFSDKLLVGVGVNAAQCVVKVGDGKDNSHLGAEFEQDAQQRNRVSTAGHGNAYAVSCAE
jgi:phage-related baseplate assembly protein